jgi:catechol 2,3-dioxygenase-like lactoylglutathione lyase family enzyme
MRRLHHVNVVVPPGATSRVVDFYVDTLGLRQVAKPTDDVAQSGAQSSGAWFDIDDRTQVHVSERDGERHPQSHFGLVVDDFDSVLARLRDADAPWEDQPPIFGGRRGFTRDPEGNRVEILEPGGDLA